MCITYDDKSADISKVAREYCGGIFEDYKTTLCNEISKLTKELNDKKEAISKYPLETSQAYVEALMLDGKIKALSKVVFDLSQIIDIDLECD
jgi:hypothetical protein